MTEGKRRRTTTCHIYQWYIVLHGAALCRPIRQSSHVEDKKTMSQSSSSVPRGSPTSQDDHTACGASDSATKERSASILSGRHDCNSRRYESMSQWYSRHLHSYLPTSRKDAESASLAKLLDPACACFAPSIFHPQLPVRSSSPRAHFSFIFTPTTHFSSSKGPRSALISTRRTHL